MIKVPGPGDNVPDEPVRPIKAKAYILPSALGKTDPEELRKLTARLLKTTDLKKEFAKAIDILQEALEQERVERQVLARSSDGKTYALKIIVNNGKEDTDQRVGEYEHCEFTLTGCQQRGGFKTVDFTLTSFVVDEKVGKVSIPKSQGFRKDQVTRKQAQVLSRAIKGFFKKK